MQFWAICPYHSKAPAEGWTFCPVEGKLPPMCVIFDKMLAGRLS